MKLNRWTQLACTLTLICALGPASADDGCDDVEFLCPYGNRSYEVPTEVSYDNPYSPFGTCEFTGRSATDRMFESCAVPCCNHWPERANGCSVPSVLPGVKKFANLEFLDACNLHDYCYSSPGADKGNCDQELLENMHSICNVRFSGATNTQYRVLCMEYANIIHTAVFEAAGSAFSDDQKYVAANCPDETREPYFTQNLLYGETVAVRRVGIPPFTKTRYLRMVPNQDAYFSPGAESATLLYLRPANGGSPSCVRSGDQVYLAHTDNESPNQCGPWGCRVLGLAANGEPASSADARTARFNHGAEATPLYIYSLSNPSSTACLTYRDQIVFTQTPQSAPFNPDCGTWGCRVLQPRKNDFRAVLDHSLPTGLDNMGVQVLMIAPFEGCLQ